MTSEKLMGESDHVVYLLGFSPRLTEEHETQIKHDLPHLESIRLRDVTAWYVKWSVRFSRDRKLKPISPI
jgi:hypothetical protein